MNTAWQLPAAEGWLLRVELAKCCIALSEGPHGLILRVLPPGNTEGERQTRNLKKAAELPPPHL